MSRHAEYGIRVFRRVDGLLPAEPVSWGQAPRHGLDSKRGTLDRHHRTAEPVS
jgi:hypothetical protein